MCKKAIEQKKIGLSGWMEKVWWKMWYKKLSEIKVIVNSNNNQPTKQPTTTTVFILSTTKWKRKT